MKLAGWFNGTNNSNMSKDPEKCDDPFKVYIWCECLMNDITQEHNTVIKEKSKYTWAHPWSLITRIITLDKCLCWQYLHICFLPVCDPVYDLWLGSNCSYVWTHISLIINVSFHTAKRWSLIAKRAFSAIGSSQSQRPAFISTSSQ